MTEHAVLEYVANSVWQVPLLAGIAWLAIRAGRPEPRVQYRMWVGTLTLAVVLPLVQPTIFRIYIPKTAQNQLANPEHGISIVASIGDEQAAQPEHVARAEVASAQGGDIGAVSRGVKSESPTAPHSIQLNGFVWNWLLGIYFSIVLLRLAHLARSRRAAEKLLRNAREKALTPLERSVLERCCDTLGVTAPRVLFSREARTPMAIGSSQPAVLLPESFHTCAEAEMQAILCHELAHVRRGDYLANWVCQLGSLPIAYHPATYGIDREIRRSRELTCDAIAAAAVGSPVGYARCLVGLARQIEGKCGETGAAESGSAAASGLFDHDVFEERIMRLLDTKNVSGRTAMWRVAGAAALIAGAAVCAAALHITPVVLAAEANATLQQTATSAPAQILTSQAQAPVKIPAGVQEHAVAAKTKMPVKAIAPVHAAMPLKVVVPINTVMPLKPITPVQTAIPVLSTMPVRAVVSIAELAEPLHGLGPLQDVPPAKPTPPSSPSVAKAGATTPPAPVAPTTPASPIVPRQPAPPAVAYPEHDLKGAGITFDLTPEQRTRMDRELAAATARIQAQAKMLNSPEFKVQMAEMRRQIEAATKQMRSAEFQAQMKALQSPEFKKQMADMRLQLQAATKQMQSARIQAQMKYMQSPEYKKQMADMQRQIQQATKQLRSAQFQAQMKYFQSPEFKKQMADTRLQVQEATKQMQSARFQQQMKYLQSPEFKKQMEDAQREIQEATRNFEKDRMNLDMKQMPKRGTPVAPSDKDNSVPR